MKIWTRITVPSWECNTGGSYLNIVIELSEAMMERLLLCAAEEEASAEEIIIRAIRNFMNRSENIG